MQYSNAYIRIVFLSTESDLFTYLFLPITAHLFMLCVMRLQPVSESLMLCYTAVIHPSSLEIVLLPVHLYDLSSTIVENGDIKSKSEVNRRKKCFK